MQQYSPLIVSKMHCSKWHDETWGLTNGLKSATIVMLGSFWDFIFVWLNCKRGWLAGLMCAVLRFDCLRWFSPKIRNSTFIKLMIDWSLVNRIRSQRLCSFIWFIGHRLVCFGSWEHPLSWLAANLSSRLRLLTSYQFGAAIRFRASEAVVIYVDRLNATGLNSCRNCQWNTHVVCYSRHNFILWLSF